VRPAGNVVSTSPAAGTSIEQGKTVTVQISRGNLTKIPDVTGKTQSDAYAILQEHQFTVVVRPSLTRDESMVGKVISQDPDAGQVRKIGSKVTIFIGQASAPPTTAGEPTGEPSPEPT
jgi:serine/threonine-protein kinase